MQWVISRKTMIEKQTKSIEKPYIHRVLPPSGSIPHLNNDKKMLNNNFTLLRATRDKFKLKSPRFKKSYQKEFLKKY